MFFINIFQISNCVRNILCCLLSYFLLFKILSSCGKQIPIVLPPPPPPLPRGFNLTNRRNPPLILIHDINFRTTNSKLFSRHVWCQGILILKGHAFQKLLFFRQIFNKVPQKKHFSRFFFKNIACAATFSDKIRGTCSVLGALGKHQLGRKASKFLKNRRRPEKILDLFWIHRLMLVLCFN